MTFRTVFFYLDPQILPILTKSTQPPLYKNHRVVVKCMGRPPRGSLGLLLPARRVRMTRKHPLRTAVTFFFLGGRHGLSLPMGFDCGRVDLQREPGTGTGEK